MVSVIICVCPQMDKRVLGTNNVQLCVSFLNEQKDKLQLSLSYLYKIITHLMLVGTDFDRLDLLANY